MILAFFIQRILISSGLNVEAQTLDVEAQTLSSGFRRFKR